jgi:hypothetical protein
MVDHVEVLVEEPSMEATLRELVPRIVGATSFQIYPFQSKQDLLRKLPDDSGATRRGYRGTIESS